MPSAWGGSWGSSWGNSWGATEVPPTFASDTLGAGAGHRKKPDWRPPELYFPPVKDAAEIAAERERRKKLLLNVKRRQEAVARAGESKRLLAILQSSGNRFGKRFEAAIDLLGGKYEVAQASPDGFSAFLAELLNDDEESEYEREVSRSTIARHISELWVEDPERFEQLWMRMKAH